MYERERDSRLAKFVAAAWQHHKITGSCLRALDHDMLCRMGMERVGVQIRLLDALSTFLDAHGHEEWRDVAAAVPDLLRVHRARTGTSPRQLESLDRLAPRRVDALLEPRLRNGSDSEDARIAVIPVFLTIAVNKLVEGMADEGVDLVRGTRAGTRARGWPPAFATASGWPPAFATASNPLVLGFAASFKRSMRTLQKSSKTVSPTQVHDPATTFTVHFRRRPSRGLGERRRLPHAGQRRRRQRGRVFGIEIHAFHRLRRRRRQAAGVRGRV